MAAKADTRRYLVSKRACGRRPRKPGANLISGMFMRHQVAQPCMSDLSSKCLTRFPTVAGMPEAHATPSSTGRDNSTNLGAMTPQCAQCTECAQCAQWRDSGATRRFRYQPHCKSTASQLQANCKHTASQLQAG